MSVVQYKRSRLSTDMLAKLRMKGFSFREIGLCAGIGQSSVHEHLKNHCPELMTLEAYRDNEAHYYDIEAVKALSLGSLLRDYATSEYVQHGRIDNAALTAASKLTADVKAFVELARLTRNQSTANNAIQHFGTVYHVAEQHPPDYIEPPLDALPITHAAALEERARVEPHGDEGAGDSAPSHIKPGPRGKPVAGRKVPSHTPTIKIPPDRY